MASALLLLEAPSSFLLHFFIIMNNATISIHLCILVWTYAFIFLEQIPRSGIALASGKFVFYLSRRVESFPGGLCCYKTRHLGEGDGTDPSIASSGASWPLPTLGFWSHLQTCEK